MKPQPWEVAAAEQVVSDLCGRWSGCQDESKRLTIPWPNGSALETRIRIEIAPDDWNGPPWEDEDGHGPVSDWTDRPKRPGERVLHQDRGRRRYYDFQAAVEAARKEGWDSPPLRTGTPGEQAVRAVESDFRYLKEWCDDDWQYVFVRVEVEDEDGNRFDDQLSGVGTFEGYSLEVAREMLADCFRELWKERAELYRAACSDVWTERRVG